MKSSLAETRRRSRKSLSRVARLLSHHNGRLAHVVRSIADYYRLKTASRLWQSLNVQLPNGLKIALPKCYIRSYLGSFDDVYVHREYDLLHDYRPSINDVVFDVGASMGLYTLECSRLVGKKGKIYAVEALPSFYDILLNNIRINGVDNVVPINVAVGAFEGTSHVYLDALLPSRSSTHSRHVEALSSVKHKIETKLTTLDTLISQHGVHNIDLLKIDVEGAELDVLKGNINALNEGIVDRMIVEMHETCVNLKDMTEFLQERSYLVDGVFASDYLKKIVYAKFRR